MLVCVWGGLGVGRDWVVRKADDCGTQGEKRWQKTGAYGGLSVSHLTRPIGGEWLVVSGQLLETVRYLGIAVSGVLKMVRV